MEILDSNDANRKKLFKEIKNLSWKMVNQAITDHQIIIVILTNNSAKLPQEIVKF